MACNVPMATLLRPHGARSLCCARFQLLEIGPSFATQTELCGAVGESRLYQVEG
jgi:hypothetical protein